MRITARRIVALYVVAGGLFTAVGCGVVDTGVSVSGPAPSPSGPTSQTQGGTTMHSVDAVKVLREDPGVSDTVKDAVAQPCAEDYGKGWYPVYVRYHEIPDAGIPVALVNVQGCGREVACSGAMAGYVYRLWEDRSERIYTTADGASEVGWYEGGPVVERTEWAADSGSGTCPDSVTRTKLEWDGAGLTERGQGSD